MSAMIDEQCTCSNDEIPWHNNPDCLQRKAEIESAMNEPLQYACDEHDYQGFKPCQECNPGSVSLWEQFKALPLEQQKQISSNGFCWIWGRIEGSDTEIEEQFFKRVRYDMTHEQIQEKTPPDAPLATGQGGQSTIVTFSKR
jgi:hypothetical protein